MTTEAVLWTASLGAAALFFAAGFLAGRLSRRADASTATARLPAAPALVPGDWAGARLQAWVEALRREGGIHAAVVADELGLVVASSGELGEELAAVGAQLAHAGARVRGIVPIGRVRRLTLEDEHDVRVSVRPIEPSEAELALVTLETAAPSPAGADHAAGTRAAARPAAAAWPLPVARPQGGQP